jgi:iron complex outermembrane receptor protein
MRKNRNGYLLLLAFVWPLCIIAQNPSRKPTLTVTITNEQGAPLEGVVADLRKKDGTTIAEASVSNKKGLSVFYIPISEAYLLHVYSLGFRSQSFPVTAAIIASSRYSVQLITETSNLTEVTVRTRKPFIEQSRGRTIVNVEASVTSAGTTVLELLEKSPGVMVDKNGGISLQGKTGVLVLIDDKPTYMSGADLNNLLSGISSSQVEQIELMNNPPARYDASGNAGIINIKTKKNKQVGMNGNLSSTLSQGVYPKLNNSLALNYRNGKFNGFLTWSGNASKGFIDIYALRRYYNNGTVFSMLDQPTYMVNSNLSNTVKTGLDYYLSEKTTLGVVFTGIAVNRSNSSDAKANWKKPSGVLDSTIRTFGHTENRMRNAGVNVNLRHRISKTQDIGADFDALQYDLTNNQSFSNLLQTTGGYREGSRGSLPATISILSAKADYTLQTGKNSKLESGYKMSEIHTDNTAAYELYDGTNWREDLNKSNHFLYRENIHALYSSFEKKEGRLSFQLGLRYENTRYTGNQLGNARQKDSLFTNNYGGLFPSGYLSYQADSSNTFTVTAGRRIDRPAFQKLNPYVIIINKYTYERGNPYFLPQYSWNLELSHQYKQWLTTAVSYSIINNYFSQLFLNEGNDILVYTNGNVGKMYNLGISSAVQLQPAPWWSLNAQVLFNHKQLSGYRNVSYASDISQWNFNMNQQFKTGVYTFELTGFYTTRARNDLQELLYPTGQLSFGIAKQVLQKKGTLRLTVRDIFFSQVMEGLTDFPGADEYFILRRDSRMVSLGFSLRFGKPIKTQKRNTGAAKDEVDRVG